MSFDDVWRRKSHLRDGDDESEEEEGWWERFFVGFGREERRYKFDAHRSEIESNGCEILLWSEYGDEKVD